MHCGQTSEPAPDETEIETQHQIMLQGGSLDIPGDIQFILLNTNDLYKIVTFLIGCCSFRHFFQKRCATLKPCSLQNDFAMPKNMLHCTV